MWVTICETGDLDLQHGIRLSSWFRQKNTNTNLRFQQRTRDKGWIRFLRGKMELVPLRPSQKRMGVPKKPLRRLFWVGGRLLLRLKLRLVLYVWRALFGWLAGENKNEKSLWVMWPQHSIEAWQIHARWTVCYSWIALVVQGNS